MLLLESEFHSVHTMSQRVMYFIIFIVFLTVIKSMFGIQRFLDDSLQHWIIYNDFPTSFGLKWDLNFHDARLFTQNLLLQQLHWHVDQF